jgi:uncharacterized protein DUF6916
MQPAPTLTRRSLLRSGAIASAAALVGLRPWAAAPALAAQGHLLRSSYEGLVGHRFTAGSIELTLLSVSDLAGAAVDASLSGSEDAFVLAFAGPLEPALEGGTLTLTHPGLGTFELFLSPVDAPAADRRYEAVVDRSVGAPKTPRKRPAAAPAAAAAAGTAAAPAEARTLKRPVRRIALRRTARGARADLVLSATAGIERVYGRLARRGKTIAVAAGDVRGRRTALRFRGAPNLAAGTYTVHLVLVDGQGRSVVRRRRVKLG